MMPVRIGLLIGVLSVPLLLQAQSKNNKVEGYPNTYVLGQPSGYNAARKWPLLILLHGSGDRAENMFPIWRTAELTKNVIVCALNSRNPQGWDGEDEKAILALIPQLSKEFSVDPAQIWLGGFSAGGFMTAAVEISNHKLFAGAIIMGSGDAYARQFKEEYKAAAQTDYFYLFVGEKDPNNPVMKQTDKNLEALGCKHKKFVEAAGIGHTYRPQDVQEIGKWLAKNGEAIYGTRGGPIAPHAWGVTTRKGNRVYIHVLDAPDRALLLPPPEAVAPPPEALDPATAPLRFVAAVPEPVPPAWPLTARGAPATVRAAAGGGAVDDREPSTVPPLPVLIVCDGGS